MQDLPRRHHRAHHAPTVAPATRPAPPASASFRPPSRCSTPRGIRAVGRRPDHYRVGSGEGDLLQALPRQGRPRRGLPRPGGRRLVGPAPRAAAEAAGTEPADQLVGPLRRPAERLPPRRYRGLRVHQRRRRVRAGHASARPHCGPQGRRPRLGRGPRGRGPARATRRRWPGRSRCCWTAGSRAAPSTPPRGPRGRQGTARALVRAAVATVRCTPAPADAWPDDRRIRPGCLRRWHRPATVSAVDHVGMTHDQVHRPGRARRADPRRPARHRRHPVGVPRRPARAGTAASSLTGRPRQRARCPHRHPPAVRPRVAGAAGRDRVAGRRRIPATTATPASIASRRPPPR